MIKIDGLSLLLLGKLTDTINTKLRAQGKSATSMAHLAGWMVKSYLAKNARQIDEEYDESIGAAIKGKFDLSELADGLSSLFQQIPNTAGTGRLGSAGDPFSSSAKAFGVIRGVASGKTRAATSRRKKPIKQVHGRGPETPGGPVQQRQTTDGIRTEAAE